MELDRRLQTCNLVIVFAVDICHHAVFARWDLLRKVHVFAEACFALLDRAFEVDVLDRIAEIRGLLDDRDKTVLNLQLYCGTFLDIFAERAFGGDRESLAAVSVY